MFIDQSECLVYYFLCPELILFCIELPNYLLDALNILYNAEHYARHHLWRHNLSDPAGDLLLIMIDIMIDTAAPFDQESECFSISKETNGNEF